MSHSMSHIAHLEIKLLHDFLLRQSVKLFTFALFHCSLFLACPRNRRVIALAMAEHPNNPEEQDRFFRPSKKLDEFGKLWRAWVHQKPCNLACLHKQSEASMTFFTWSRLQSRHWMFKTTKSGILMSFRRLAGQSEMWEVRDKCMNIQQRLHARYLFEWQICGCSTWRAIHVPRRYQTTEKVSLPCAKTSSNSAPVS